MQIDSKKALSPFHGQALPPGPFCLSQLCFAIKQKWSEFDMWCWKVSLPSNGTSIFGFPWALHAQTGLNKINLSRISPIPTVCEIQPVGPPRGNGISWLGFGFSESILGCCELTAPPGPSQRGFPCLTQNCCFSGGQCHFPCIFLLCQCRIRTQLYMETWLGLPNQHRTELQEPMGRQKLTRN